jgi:hypothetical protein
VDVPCCGACRWVLDHRLLRRDCQPDYHSGDVECRGPHKKKFHGCDDLPGILRWEYCRPAACEESNEGAALSGALDGADHLVCVPVPDTNTCKLTLASYVICIASSVALYVVLLMANKRKEAVPEDEAERAKLAFQDLTDKENPYFRYVL